MLSNYPLKIKDLYNISIDKVKKLVHNYFDEEKYVHHYKILKLYLTLGLTLKKFMYMIIQSMTIAKTICPT